MKSFFTIVLAVCCAVVLYFGNAHWEKKTKAYNDPNLLNKAENQSGQSTAVNNSSISGVSNSTQLLTYTKNWPNQAVQLFHKRLAANQPFNFLIVGSSEIGSSTAGWAHLLAANLLETYGKGHMNITIEPFNGTSMQFIDSGKYIAEANHKADMILFEPFTLNDNGQVDSNNSLENLTAFMNECKKTNPETTFVLTPPNPLYNAKYYPLQVEDLKRFAAQNKITYLDHWTAWPSPNSVAIENYLLPDQSAPNDKGNQLVSDYLTKYFVSK